MVSEGQPPSHDPEAIYTEDYYRGRGSGYIFSYNIMRSRAMWLPELRAIGRYGSGGAVLDVGCALGYFLNVLPGSFDKWGVDNSKYAVELARRRIGPPERFRICDFTQNELFGSEQMFDLVTCFNVLEHFEDPRHAVKKLFTLCKPNGLVFARFPFRDPPMCRDRYHYYRPIAEWLSYFRDWGDSVEERYYFTFWGKYSDIRMPRSLANFASLIFRARC